MIIYELIINCKKLIAIKNGGGDDDDDDDDQTSLSACNILMKLISFNLLD